MLKMIALIVRALLERFKIYRYESDKARNCKEAGVDHHMSQLRVRVRL